MTYKITSSQESGYLLNDCVIYREIMTNSDHQILQQDLQQLSTWSSTWLMSFNVKKCAVLSITRKRKPSIFQYQLCNDRIPRANEYKYLGVTITDDLRWNKRSKISCSFRTWWLQDYNIFLGPGLSSRLGESSRTTSPCTVHSLPQDSLPSSQHSIPTCHYPGCLHWATRPQPQVCNPESDHRRLQVLFLPTNYKNLESSTWTCGRNNQLIYIQRDYSTSHPSDAASCWVLHALKTKGFFFTRT